MKNVGRQATMVALFCGTSASGNVISYWILPESSISFICFRYYVIGNELGIMLPFKDLTKIQRQNLQIILGAAVIDDIISLILLAIIGAIVTTGELDFFLILRISILSIMFLGAVFFR